MGIGNWESQVTDMEDMFSCADEFNQDIGNWNTSQVTNMHAMLVQASAFNHNVFGWTGTAASTSQEDMFFGATAFQRRFKCERGDEGPANSCIQLYNDYNDKIIKKKWAS